MDSAHTLSRRVAGKRLPMPTPSLGLQGQRSLRVGVLGSGEALRRAWPALHAAGHRVVCIGASDTASAAAVAEAGLEELGGKPMGSGGAAESPPPRPAARRGQRLDPRQVVEAAGLTGALPKRPRIGGCEDVLRSADVDLVYVTLPAAVRGPWVRACIVAGKHLVVEAPPAASAAELLACLEESNLRRLLLADSTAYGCSDRVRSVRERLAALGPVKSVQAHFVHPSGGDAAAALEPLGALGDLGWHAIRWTLLAVGFAVPMHVTGRITAVTPAAAGGINYGGGRGGAISAFEGSMTFPPGSGGGGGPITASFTCGYGAARQQTVTVFTAGGVVEVRDALTPRAEDDDGTCCLFTVRSVQPPSAANSFRPTATAAKVRCGGGSGAAAFWRQIGGSLIQLGAGEPLLLDPRRGSDWGRDAYVTQLVMEKLLESATMAAA